MQRVEINPECGRRLKQALVSNGITQERFGDACGYTQQYISKLVTGKRQLTREMAEKAHEIMPSVSVKWLMCDSERAWEENRKTEAAFDRIFQCFISGLEDISGYGLGFWNSDFLIGKYVYVTNEKGEKVGVIQEEDFYMLKEEIEGFASYALHRLIKERMLAIPNGNAGGTDHATEK